MARDLASLRGRSIVSVNISDSSLASHPSAAEMAHRLVGCKVERVSRRAKWLQLHLDEGVLLFHPRMTGRPYLADEDAPVEKHVRAQITFDDHTQLRLHDVRRFARLWLLSASANGTLLTDDGRPFFASYGPEPLEDAFTPAVLASRLKGGRPLKSALLDQAVLSGLGNIYVDEALYRARLHPQLRTDSLSRDQVARLHGAIVAVLSEGIASRGASVSDYQAPSGGASMQKLLRVYRRAGADCAICGETIIRMVVGGRGTHLCPSCQQQPGGNAKESTHTARAVS